MPLIPQPYKNIVKFFLATLKNVDDIEELKRIGNLFADILTDGKVTPQEWLSLGGKKGFMIYSGSVLPNSGEDYNGVGLELVGASGSLKFRTNP